MAQFDRFDICVAYYLFATRYHSGQFSKEYKILGRLQKIGFAIGAGPLTDEQLAEDFPNAKEIYDNLVNKHLN